MSKVLPASHATPATSFTQEGKSPNVSVAVEWVEMFNNNNWDNYKNIVTKDHTYEETSVHRKFEGYQAATDAAKAWRATSSDSKGKIKNVIAAGNTVVLEQVWSGKCDGVLEMPDMEPLHGTGKEFNCFTTAVFEFDKKGKIKHIRHYFDMFVFLKNFGMK